VRLLYLAFAISGGAGLIYEAVWSRYLALFVGHSAYAQVLVLAVYLGGMALGALGVGKIARTLRAPLLWYAGAEALLGLLGFLFHPVYQATTGLAYDALLPGAESAWAALVLRWGLACALILPQAVLLGTTFPLMSSGALRHFPLAPGRTLSLLYFTNSLGAAVGVMVGGFALIPWVGLPGALGVAGALNLVAAAAAATVHRVVKPDVVDEAGLLRRIQEASGSASGRDRNELGAQVSEGAGAPPASMEERERKPAMPPAWPEDPEREPATAPAWLQDPGRLLTLLLAVTFFSAGASFLYEIGWIRMLSLVMGSATHSFEVMLSAFILGLALGSLFIRDPADRAGRPLRLLGWIQWGMGLAALATLPLYGSFFDFMGFVMGTLPRTDGGYLAFAVVRYGVAMGVMMPATILAGMTLPLITASLLRGGGGERVIGWVYGFNTLGSVLGAVAGGLLLLPALGLKGTLLVGGLLDMALGVAILSAAPGRKGRLSHRTVSFGATAVTLGVGLILALGFQLDRRVLSSGVFRYGRVAQEETPEDILFYRDGATASVGAFILDPPGWMLLATNGKPDASLSLRWIRAATESLPVETIVNQDESTQLLLAMIPLAHAPDAGQAAVIGQGSGTTGHFLLSSPHLRELVTVEIEPEMIAGSERFYPANARVFDDPRSRFVIDDARSYFASNPGRYDLIVSEPSNPWVSGTSSLFTREFYQRVRTFLAPGGVFAQWMQLYEMNDRLLASVLAALHESFQDYKGYLIGPGDLLLVASADGALKEPDWSLIRSPRLRSELSHVPPFTVEFLESLLLLDRNTLDPLLAEWPFRNSDYWPYLDTGAEKARFLGETAGGFLRFAEDRVDLLAVAAGRRRGLPTEMTEPVRGMAPSQAILTSVWLRQGRGAEPALEEASRQDLGEALERLQEFRRRLDSREAPEDWRRFSLLASRIEADLHGRAAGVGDTLYFGELFRYLREQGAPREAVAAAEFLNGVAVWDHARASAAAELLVEAAGRGEEWVPIPTLRDGVVAARLALGDAVGAEEAFRRLMGLMGGEGDDARVWLLEALIRRGGGIPSPPE
jgi:spermidine synthase